MDSRLCGNDDRIDCRLRQWKPVRQISNESSAMSKEKELVLVVDAVANEKGVDKDVIFDAMEAALASAAK